MPPPLPPPEPGKFSLPDWPALGELWQAVKSEHATDSAKAKKALAELVRAMRTILLQMQSR